MPSLLYFDYNSTTPIDPQARAAMLPFLEHSFGNPSNSYFLGRQAAEALEQARSEVAALLGARSSEIIFTSGASESIRTAFHAALEANPKKKHLLSCTTEHQAVLACCHEYERRGYQVTLLPVDAQGMLSLKALEEAITPSTALLSLLWANNETGVIFPVEEIVAIAQRKKVPLHLDAVQAAGKIPINLEALPIDYLSLAGHKIYASKGIGVLYVHRHAFYQPLFAGSQESERRAGTQNMPAILSLGKAAQLAKELLPAAMKREALLRDTLERGLLEKISNLSLHGRKEYRLSNTTNLGIAGIQAAQALLLLDQEGLCCSAASACHGSSRDPSHVLRAMHLTPAEALSSLRFSLGRFTTEEEIERALEIIPRVVKKLRSL